MNDIGSRAGTKNTLLTDTTNVFVVVVEDEPETGVA
jgi:hypothetical protein